MELGGGGVEMGSEVEVGEGNWRGEERQESSEHLWDLSWRPWLRIPNPKTMPTRTRTVTMKIKIFVALPT